MDLNSEVSGVQNAIPQDIFEAATKATFDRKIESSIREGVQTAGYENT